jgi:hypothetical protein
MSFKEAKFKKAKQKRLICEISVFSLQLKRRASGEERPSLAPRETRDSAVFCWGGVGIDLASRASEEILQLGARFSEENSVLAPSQVAAVYCAWSASRDPAVKREAAQLQPQNPAGHRRAADKAQSASERCGETRGEKRRHGTNPSFLLLLQSPFLKQLLLKKVLLMDQLKKKHRVLPLRLKKKKPPPQQQQQRKEIKSSLGGALYEPCPALGRCIVGQTRDADVKAPALRLSTVFLKVEKGVILECFLDIKSIEKHESA